MYIYSIDSSLANTGICIFESETGKPKQVFSIQTNAKYNHANRLKIIADFFLKLREKYPTNIVVFEQGFSRYSISTQALFKVIGVISYVFWDCEQLFYAPSTVKKAVTGNGRADKKDVQKEIKKRWPYLNFENDDQSDACAVGICYLLDKGKLKK